MERKKLFYWLAQIFGWGGYFAFSAFLLLYTSDFILTNLLVLYIVGSIVVSIALSHGIRFVMIRRNLLGKPLIELIGVTLLLCIIGASLLELFQTYFSVIIQSPLDFINGPAETEEQGSQAAAYAFAVTRSLLLFLLWSGCYYVFIVIDNSRKQEIQKLQLDVSKNEIELKNLRAQLNPHFLFNSLNSIRALVGIDPENAKTAITRLSSLLRHSISLGKLKLIPLKQELEIIKSYLELEQIRFEERLEVKYNCDESAMNCEIPPLMLQTIVENAIKHGISKEIEGGEIEVKARFEQQVLTIEVLNTGTLELNEIGSGGVGIPNTQKRLSILFGSNADFSISQEGEKVLVKINITYP